MDVRNVMWTASCSRSLLRRCHNSFTYNFTKTMWRWLPCLSAAEQAGTIHTHNASPIRHISSVEDVKDNRLLLGLPGPVWATLWACLPAKDQLHLFQLCRGTRDRVLSSHVQSARFTVPKDAQLSSAVQSQCRALLQRSQPLGKLTLAGVPESVGNAAAVTALLREVASGHAAAQAGESEPWHAAVSLRELELQDVQITAEAAALLPQAFPQLSTLRLVRCQQHTPAVVKALRSCQHLTHLTLQDPQHVDSCNAGDAESGEAMDAAALWEAAVAEVSASGDGALLQAVASNQDVWKGESKRAAATGLLLCTLPHLTSVDVQMNWSSAAFSMLASAIGRRLEGISLSDRMNVIDRVERFDLFKKDLAACSKLTSLGLSVGLEGEVPAVLAAIPDPAKLRRLSMPFLILSQKLLDLFLEKLPGLEHLAIDSFGELRESRASAPCAWRSLEQVSSDITPRTLAYLPLHSLTSFQAFGHGKEARLRHQDTEPEGADALVEAAQANLARCKPGLTSAQPLQVVTVESSHIAPCPSLLRLLAFFPSAEKLVLNMEGIRDDELDCLAEAGRFCSGVQELVVESPSLLPFFFSPALWDALPALRSLRLDAYYDWSADVGAIVSCLAAAPHPVSVQGPWFHNQKAQAQLKKKLMALPAGKVKVKDGE